MTAVAVTAGSSAHLAPRSVAWSEFISSSVTEIVSVFEQINLRSLSIEDLPVSFEPVRTVTSGSKVISSPMNGPKLVARSDFTGRGDREEY